MEYGHEDLFILCSRLFVGYCSSSSTRLAESHNRTASFEFYLLYLSSGRESATGLCQRGHTSDPLDLTAILA